MATAAANRSTQSTRRTHALQLVAAVLVLLLLGNIAYIVFARPFSSVLVITPTTIDARVIDAVPVANGQAVAVTSTNHVFLFNNGNVIKDVSVEKTVSVLAVSPNGQIIVAGTSERELVVWNAVLEEQRRLEVNGRVSAVHVGNNGQITVAHAVGQFTGKVWVSTFDPNSKQLTKKQTGIDITSMTGAGNAIIYSTVDGSVTAFTSDDASLWRTQIPQPATVLASTASGVVFVGGERGGVSRIGADGALAWTQQLGEYRIRTLAIDVTSGAIAVCDDNKQLFLLDGATGQTLYQTTTTGVVRGVTAIGEGKIGFLTNNGSLITVDINAARKAPQPLVTGLYLGANVLLLATAFGGTIAAVPRWRVRALHTGRQIRRSRTAYMLLLPAFVLILMFSYLPTALGLYYSFTNFNLREPLRFIGFSNFVKLARDSVFWIGVGNMILIVSTSILKTLTLPLLVAELLYWLRGPKLKYFFRSAFIIPSIVPGIVGVLLWKMIYDPSIGLINVTLESLGLSSWQQAWLADERLALWSIIFAGFPWISTFAFLVFLGGLLDINLELFDAAAIDGATWWQRFRHIDWRLIAPQLRLVLFFTFVGSIQEYGNIYIFTGGGPGTSTYVPGLYMFLQTAGGEFGYAASIGFVLALVVLLVTVWRFRFGTAPSDA